MEKGINIVADTVAGLEEKTEQSTQKKATGKKVGKISHLKKARDTKFNQQTQKTIEIEGVQYTYKVDDVFSPSKTSALMSDLAVFLETNMQNPVVIGFTQPYIYLMSIKHFTSWDISEEIGEALNDLNTLIDLDVFSKVIDSLPEAEMIKLLETAASTFDQMRENMEEEARLIEEETRNQEKLTLSSAAEEMERKTESKEQ